MRRKWLVGILSLTLVVSVFSSDVYAAGTAKDLKKIQENKKETKQELDQATSDVKKVEDELKQLETEVGKMDDQINEINQKYQENQKRMAERKQALEKRVVQMYETGNTSYVKQLLTSSSFSEFFDRLEITRLLVESDQQALEDFQKYQEKVEQEKAQLTELQAKQKPLLDQAKEKFDSLKKKQNALNKELKTLEGEEKLTIQQIREKNKAVADSTKFYNGPAGSGQLQWPTQSHNVTSGFKFRNGRMHEGIDLGVPIGTPIFSADDGAVTLIKSDPDGYGNYIVIAHGNKLSTLYAHMKRTQIVVSVGQHVKKGQLIAYSGNEGRSSGPHLHFEVHKGSYPVDPMLYLR